MTLDWTGFHAASVARARTTALADACERVLQWIQLEPGQRAEAVPRDLDAGMEPALAVEALRLVCRKRWRDAGVDVDDTMALQAAFEAVAQGRASDALASTVHDANVIAEMWPIANARVTAEPPEIIEQRARLADATAAFVAVRERTDGPATTAAYDQLHRAALDLEKAGEGFVPPLAREHAWWMGLVYWRLGAVARDLGRFVDAQAALEQSATHYEAAGEAKSAADCRDQARDLVHRLSADVDAATVDDVRALLTDLPPFARATALVRLSANAGSAGDRFESERMASEAGRILRKLGYSDPMQAVDGDPVPALNAPLQAWLNTAAAAHLGSDLERHLSEVTRHWAQILTARMNAPSDRDPEGSRRADLIFRALTDFPAELQRQGALASQRAIERLAQWSSEFAASAPAEPAPEGIDFRDVHAFNDALYRLKLAYEQEPDASQLEIAATLHADAVQKGWRIQAASALIERARILFALRRYDEVSAAADLAAERLLDGRAPQLASFASAHERQLYVRAMLARSHGCAVIKDWEGVLATCLPLLQEVERERERVSDPFQKSAAMAERVELYEMVVIAAYKLERRDLLLDTTERLKARASLSSRLDTSDGAEPTEAERDWQAVNEAMRTASGDDEHIAALRERRRWLSTLVAIERARTRGVPETTTVAAIQGALSADEAAVSWFWIQDGALFVQIITADSYELIPIHLEGRDQSQLQEFLAAASSVGEADPDDDAFFDRFDALVASLASVLLPDAVRRRIADRRRLILSPHRSLHLFPFHAAPWSEQGRSGFLMEFSAVRYVPNLTSLLLPWDGSTNGRVLAVGVSNFDDPLHGSLPEAEDEAEAVAAIHGSRGVALTGPDRETFAAALSREAYRCVHLATHGSSVLHGDSANDPRLSSFALRDGDLSAWDLSTLDLRAELVVLAACHSGQRAVAGRGLESLPGDDLFGLQGVFFEAGAWGVLGSLWPVEDLTARQLMTVFHREYADGAPPDIALHRATVEYLADRDGSRSPFTWAPFVLVTLGQRPDSGADR